MTYSIPAGSLGPMKIDETGHAVFCYGQPYPQFAEILKRVPGNYEAYMKAKPGETVVLNMGASK